MRKKRIKLKGRIYPLFLSGIIVLSVYLLIRFAALSFSDNIGQADLSFIDALFSNVCCKAVEEGSSLISFSKEEDRQYSFPVKMVADEFAIDKYTEDNTVLTASAKDYSKILGENSSLPDNEESQETMNTEVGNNGLGFYEINEGHLSREYILTNGSVYNSNMAGQLPDGQKLDNGQTDDNEELQVGYSEGDVNYEDTDKEESEESNSSVETMNPEGTVKYTMEQLQDTDFLIKNFYIVHKTTKVTNKLFDAKKLLSKDLTIKQENDKPQILIYHTHSQETYCDSTPGKASDTVVGVGSYLTKILEDEYGYNVIHDKTTYDIVDGIENRNIAYNQAEKGLEKTLKENPTIEVLIDIHRDSGAARTIEIDGKETAKIMLFNGLSRDLDGPITSLENPNQQANLAFSLQLQMKSLDLYPGLFIKNYLKSYRFNLHFREKSMLMELGSEGNTLQSAKNAMVPFAEILDDLLQGK